MNFSTTPPWASICDAGHREVRGEHPVDVLGVGRLRRRVKPDEVAEQRRDDLALLGNRSDRGRKRRPQPLQNRAPTGCQLRRMAGDHASQPIGARDKPSIRRRRLPSVGRGGPDSQGGDLRSQWTVRADLLDWAFRVQNR